MENSISRDIGGEIIAKLKEIILRLNKLKSNEEKLSNTFVSGNRS